MTTATPSRTRDLDVNEISQVVTRLCQEATHFLPEDVEGALKRASGTEKSPLGKAVLLEIVENAAIAREQMVPLCQDTGTTVVMVEVGQDVHLVGGDLRDAINGGVGQGYTEGFLRASIVDQPLTNRVNTKNNTPAVIHTEVVPGDQVHLTVIPKGGGCENMSRFTVMLPASGRKGVTDFVLRTIEESGGNPCPPLIVGVGVGGSSEYAMFLAKKGITRQIGEHHPDPEVAQFEIDLLEKVNALGVGPQSVGGSNTALAVNVETYPTHIASLPVGVNLQCHSARLKRATL
ncbi:MAG: fumarate hydratase [Dehalococcoidia bacterium]|nr:fumarate hydratase [Dehalococcoidia bacterium]